MSMFNTHIGMNGPGSDDEPMFPWKAPIISIIFTALAIIVIAWLLISSARSAQKEDILIFCDRTVIRSVETAQYDRERLIAVLRKEKAAGNCALSARTSLASSIKSSDRNRVVCSGNSCLLYIQSDIYDEVR